MTIDFSRPPVPVDAFRAAVVERVTAGARFAGLFASSMGDATRLVVVLATVTGLEVERTVLTSSRDAVPSLTPSVPSAEWYEREISDLFGVRVSGVAPQTPLLFAFGPNEARPRPGSGNVRTTAQPDLTPLTPHLRGEGVFTISYGPVRSGVFESVEYVVETPGEDIPHLGLHVSYKHRGVETHFEGKNVNDGVLVAERCEGVASVAHALSFCGAVEEIGDLQVSLQANLVRVLHAELERIANHLDSVIRHCEAAGQAVAFARFSLHKEAVQRLRARLCGSRFGRGVVVPGGVSAAPALSASELRDAVELLQRDIESDTHLLMNTPSFLDRLRGTGVLPRELVRQYGALGPVARGSGEMDDVRASRPYSAYARLDFEPLAPRPEGDALSRQKVRASEIRGSFNLIHLLIEELERAGEPARGQWTTPLPELDGAAIGWAEAPQGEVLTWVEVNDGVLTRVKPRSASFQNMQLFTKAFPKDILTDFAFIEASFGLSIAGVAS